jgi:hypothetical protein
MWLALAAGIGCGVCAYAGLYPRFDDGALRVVLGATSLPFAAAVVASSLSARSGARAFGMALLVAGLLGAASTIIPAAILARRNGGEFIFACFFGGFFGAITGVLYGLPLAVLAGAGHAHVRAQTHESTDRAARIAGLWLAVVSLVGLAGTRLLDPPVLDYATQTWSFPSTIPTAVACAAALAGLVAVVRASVRMRRRDGWIERVRAGLEPAFRTRVVDLRDRIDGLPRLGEGATVVEFVADEVSEATSGAAYRISAAGTAVAVVSDPR